jgi:L-asparaginase
MPNPYRLLSAIVVAVALLPAAAMAQPTRTQADRPRVPAAEAAAVLAPITALFAAFETGDAAAMLRQVHAAGRVTASGTRGDGSSNLRQQSWTEFAARVRPDRAFAERISDPVIDVDGDIAMVWAPFVVRVGGTISNCGFDHFDLVREQGAWKVMNLTFSSRTTGCPVEAAPSASATARPKVLVLSTGGTIAGTGASPTDLSNYRAGTLSGQALVDAVPQIRQIADVTVEQIANVNSSDITLDIWLKLAQRINRILADDPAVAGIVVTHGTNTLEETAYFLNLTVKSDRPVVLVGAMRPATAISADGPLNLLNAVRTAISPDARGKGALIVMNDEINGARDVTKTSTYRVETFRSPELGALGSVDDDKVAFYRASTRRHTADSEFDVSALTTLPRVDIVYSYVEPDTAMIETAVAQQPKGLVVAGTGAGALSAFEKAAVAALAKLPATSRPVIVRSSRVGNGRVIGRPEFDDLGTVPADNLNPQKARILLMLALTKTSDPKDIKRMFDQY